MFVQNLHAAFLCTAPNSNYAIEFGDFSAVFSNAFLPRNLVLKSSFLHSKIDEIASEYVDSDLAN